MYNFTNILWNKNPNPSNSPIKSINWNGDLETWFLNYNTVFDDPEIWLIRTALTKFSKLKVLQYFTVSPTLKIKFVGCSHISTRWGFVCPLLFSMWRESSVEGQEGLADIDRSAFGVYSNVYISHHSCIYIPSICFGAYHIIHDFTNPDTVRSCHVQIRETVVLYTIEN